MRETYPWGQKRKENICIISCLGIWTRVQCCTPWRNAMPVTWSTPLRAPPWSASTRPSPSPSTQTRSLPCSRFILLHDFLDIFTEEEKISESVNILIKFDTVQMYFWDFKAVLWLWIQIQWIWMRIQTFGIVWICIHAYVIIFLHRMLKTVFWRKNSFFKHFF